MSKRARQYIGILAAVIAYYLVHEGVHLLYALLSHRYVWDSVSEIHGTGTQIPRKKISQIRNRQMEFCGKVRELRKNRGLTQEELAVCQYARWCTGQRCDLQPD